MALGGIMSEENLRILIEFFGAVLVAFMTYFFTRSHYERKRRDELADREFNRRLSAKDKKIADAQDYLNAYLELTRTITRIELGMVTSGDTDTYEAEVNKIPDLTNNLTANRMISIMQLGDSELQGLNIQLMLLARQEYENLCDLLSAMKREDTVDKNAILERISEFSGKTGVVITKIQVRLNTLAEKM